MQSPRANPQLRVPFGKSWPRFIVAPVALGLAIYFWQSVKATDHSAGFWVSIGFLVLLALCCLIHGETLFDTTGRTLERRWRLFGIVPVWYRRLQTSEFRSVCCQREGGLKPGDSETWLVGLERPTGRRLFVQYFSVIRGQDCPDARKYAEELATLTGLPLSCEIEAASDRRIATMKYTVRDKDYLELWMYFQKQADDIKGAMFQTVTWTIGLAAALLGFLIVKLADFDDPKATMTLDWIVRITAGSGLFVCIYSGMAIGEARKHIKRNWARADLCKDLVEHLESIIDGGHKAKGSGHFSPVWRQLSCVVAVFALAFLGVPFWYFHRPATGSNIQTSAHHPATNVYIYITQPGKTN